VCICVCVPDMIGMLSSCSHEHAPEEWGIALIFPILHEGRQISENYGGCKLGECHIQKDICEECMSDEAQNGFRKGQSCTDFTFIFYNKSNDPGYVTYRLDLPGFWKDLLLRYQK